MYTQDVDKAWRDSNLLDVGMVGAKIGLISDPATPFGDVKESWFSKEGSKYGIEDYMVLKTVTFSQHKLRIDRPMYSWHLIMLQHYSLNQYSFRRTIHFPQGVCCSLVKRGKCRIRSC